MKFLNSLLCFRGCIKGYDVGCVVQESYLGYKKEFCMNAMQAVLSASPYLP